MRELRAVTLHVCLLVFIFLPAIASGEVRRVAAGENLQTVIDAAQPGDVILLPPGVRFIGNFVLPVKSGSDYITIRTDHTGTGLPAPGNRVHPSHSAWLAKLRSPNTVAAIQTARRAHHWRLELLEFESNRDGMGDIIRLGDAAQTDLADVPYELAIDRCYIHGDPLLGQKRGVTLLSGSTSVTNSYISDMKGVGMDTQAITGWNGPGPYTIVNNYLEGAGENVMFGGTDPALVNVVPSDIVFRSNHVRKPVEWRDPLVGEPVNVTVGVRDGAGTLATGSYVYRIASRRPAGQMVTATSTATPEVTVALGAIGAIQLAWAPVPNATEYRVYRRLATDTQWQFWTVTTNSFVDTGLAGAAGGPPTAATKWTVKNLFELKSARRVHIEGNIFENNWLAAQTGYAILLKSWNQDGAAPWSVVEDVVFTRNVVRHVASAFNILGYGNPHPSQQLRNLSITHNLVTDVDSRVWGGDGRFLMIGDAPANVTIDHNTVVHNGTTIAVHGKNADGTLRTISGLRFTNTMALHNAYGIKGDGTAVGNATINAYMPGAMVTANVLAGGSAAAYPAGNFFPASSGYLGQFDADYRLVPDSAFKNAATDGTDLGADIDALLAATSTVLSGQTRVNQSPVAHNGGPYTAPTLTSIAFDGRASYDADGTLASYSWSWGDGCANTDGATATHQYTRGGSYTVALTVTDNEGATTRSTTTATIWNRAPIALAGGPYSATLGETLTVNGGASSDADGVITEYRWTWGDGTPDSIGGTPSATHVYGAPGEYVVSLTVKDDQGAVTVVVTAATIVEPRAPVSAPEIVIYAGELPVGALRGNWAIVPDAAAAGGSKIVNADAGVANTGAALASPSHYFEATFDARAGVEYRLWLRMAATGNTKWNDSIWVQFSHAVDAVGNALYRSGTTNALLVNLATTSLATEINGWGWQNRAYWLDQATSVRFAYDGVQTIRVQTREDGVQIDQIVLSPAAYFSSSPGTPSTDGVVLPKVMTDVVIHSTDAIALGGSWQRLSDPTAAAGLRLGTPDAGWGNNNAPLESPTHYVDLAFVAQANVDYRVWLRLNARNNNKFNDAVWVQFDAARSGGLPVYQIGSKSGLLVNLATSAAAVSLNGWGWQKGAYWLSETQQPSVIRFATTGKQTIRIQVREDGVSFDQVVLSPERFFRSAPGAVTADTTIVEKY